MENSQSHTPVHEPCWHEVGPVIGFIMKVDVRYGPDHPSLVLVWQDAKP